MNNDIIIFLKQLQRTIMHIELHNCMHFQNERRPMFMKDGMVVVEQFKSTNAKSLHRSSNRMIILSGFNQSQTAKSNPFIT